MVQMKRFVAICLFVCRLIPIQGLGITSDIGAACLYAIGDLGTDAFDCKTKDLEYACRCGNGVFTRSVKYCIDMRSAEFEDTMTAYSYLQDVCSSHRRNKVSIEELFQENGDNNSTYPLNTRAFDPILASVKMVTQNRDVSSLYGVCLVFFWVFVVVLGSMGNAFRWCAPFVKMQLNGPLASWLRKHIIIPALFAMSPKESDSTASWETRAYAVIKLLPSRIMSITVMCYLVLAVVFTILSYPAQGVVQADRTKYTRMLLYVADRLGIIGVIQIPLIYLFAGRNNFLVYFTGWNYKKFNIFHRWIGRITWTMLLTHGVVYVYYAIASHDYLERWSLQKWRWANVAIICGGISILMASHSIRRRFYELFKATHQILAIFFLIGSWNHCKTLGWMQPLYLSTAILTFDHVMRLVKIVVSGGIVKAKCEAVMTTSPAPTAHSIRITINHSGAWRCFPGCYVYLYALLPTMFWESHPFTLLEPATVETSNQLVILVKVKNGQTKRLAKYLTGKPNNTASINMLVEGPYGSPIPFRSYQNTVFVAGGIGITVIYTFAMDLVKQYKAEMVRQEGERQIQLVWITQSVDSVQCFANELKALNDTQFVEVSVYITRDKHYVPVNDVSYNSCVFSHSDHSADFVETSPSSSKRAVHPHANKIGVKLEEYETQKQAGIADFSASKSSSVDPSSEASTSKTDISERMALLNDLFKGKFGMFDVEFQKPRIEKILEGKIISNMGTLAIVACGPTRLCRVARNVVTKTLDLPDSSRIDYFEHQLLW